MTDALNKDINRGDFVLYTYNNYLTAALVVGTSNNYVLIIRSGEMDHKIIRSSDHLVLIPDQVIHTMIKTNLNHTLNLVYSYTIELIKIKQKMIDNDEL